MSAFVSPSMMRHGMTLVCALPLHLHEKRVNYANARLSHFRIRHSLANVNEASDRYRLARTCSLRGTQSGASESGIDQSMIPSFISV